MNLDSLNAACRNRLYRELLHEHLVPVFGGDTVFANLVLELAKRLEFKNGKLINGASENLLPPEEGATVVEVRVDHNDNVGFKQKVATEMMMTVNDEPRVTSAGHTLNFPQSLCQKGSHALLLLGPGWTRVIDSNGLSPTVDSYGADNETSCLLKDGEPIDVLRGHYKNCTPLCMWHVVVHDQPCEQELFVPRALATAMALLSTHQLMLMRSRPKQLHYRYRELRFGGFRPTIGPIERAMIGVVTAQLNSIHDRKMHEEVDQALNDRGINTIADTRPYTKTIGPMTTSLTKADRDDKLDLYEATHPRHLRTSNLQHLQNQYYSMMLQPTRRAVVRSFFCAGFHRHTPGLPELLRFFADFPGLRKMVGAKVALYYRPDNLLGLPSWSSCSNVSMLWNLTVEPKVFPDNNPNVGRALRAVGKSSYGNSAVLSSRLRNDVEQCAFRGLVLGEKELYPKRIDIVPQPIRYMRFHLTGKGGNRVVIVLHLSPCPPEKYMTVAKTLASCGSGRGTYRKRYTEVIINLTQKDDGSIGCLRASRCTTGDSRMYTAVTSSKASRSSGYLSIGVRLNARKKAIRVNAGPAVVVLENVAELTPFTHWRRVDIQSEMERNGKVTLVSPPHLVNMDKLLRDGDRVKSKRKRREAEARSPLATLSVDSPGKPPVQKRIRKLIQRRNVAAACRLFE